LTVPVSLESVQNWQMVGVGEYEVLEVESRPLWRSAKRRKNQPAHENRGQPKAPSSQKTP
jgi:hypothetical protein